jgi:hypothetical protein
MREFCAFCACQRSFAVYAAPGKPSEQFVLAEFIRPAVNQPAETSRSINQFVATPSCEHSAVYAKFALRFDSEIRLQAGKVHCSQNQETPTNPQAGCARGNAWSDGPHQDCRAQRGHSRSCGGSVFGSKPATSFARDREHKPVAGFERCELEKDFRASTQREPAGHGETNQELYGAGQGGSRERRRAACLQSCRQS